MRSFCFSLSLFLLLMITCNCFCVSLFLFCVLSGLLSFSRFVLLYISCVHFRVSSDLLSFSRFVLLYISCVNCPIGVLNCICHCFVPVGVAVIVSVVTAEIHIISWPMCTIGWYFGPILDARRQLSVVATGRRTSSRLSDKAVWYYGK
jgi:hypothetical protein